MARKSSSQRRSGCPVSAGLELLGDRWSLLIIRDLMVRGYRTFREFLNSGEGIATNVLTDRLRGLESSGILVRERSSDDRRSIHYRLAEKGIALAPVLLEMLIWGAHYEETDAPCAVIDHMEKNRAAVLAETRRRWEQRDPTPILPPFTKAAKKESKTHPKSTSPKGKAKQ